MTPIFADTFFYVAFLSESDGAHDEVVALAERLSAPIVTTDFVLTEVADGFAGSPTRQRCAQFIRSLRSDPNTFIIPAERGVFDKGLALYEERQDKSWSLTDCISFIVMQELELTHALTHDHHFEQGGFHILL